ncbi:MAG: hypothetical protein ACE361_11220 [Aureliella sp.]
MASALNQGGRPVFGASGPAGGACFNGAERNRIAGAATFGDGGGAVGLAVQSRA